MDIDYSKMSRDDLISTNKKLYARIKNMKQKKEENQKRNEILSGHSYSINCNGLIFRPRKTNIVRLVEKIVTESKIESGDLYGYRIIVPGITWKAWASAYDYDFNWNYRNVNPYYVVIKNKCYSLTLVSTTEEQSYEGLGNKKLPSYTFVLGVVRSDFEIRPGMKVDCIPLSATGYGICYFKGEKNGKK